MNNYSCIGRLGQDPQVRYFESGNVVANFSVAIDQGKDKDPLWVPCQVWGKSAEVVANYCRKGSQVGVSGQLKSESWSDKNTQQKRSRLLVNVSRIDLLGSGSKGESTSNEGRPIDEYDDIAF